MFMPSPVPSILWFRSSSIRSNSAESLGRSSSLIPMPVSSTSNVSTAVSPVLRPPTRSHTFPSCVYLTALVRIFVSTWRIRTSSPYRREGILWSTSTSSLTFLSFILWDAIFARSWIRLLISYSTGTISIFPESILEKSRISLISDSSV